MGTRQGMAICKDCRKNKKAISDSYDDGEFWIVLEWMDKEKLIDHIKETECPICGGNNWYLTDSSQI